MLTKKDMNKLAGLLYLLSVSQNSSKRKASDSLKTSMDTVNKYLGELEAELGFKLLASNGRGTQITPQAQEILPLADTLKSILREIEYTVAANSQVSGVVNVGIDDSIVTVPFTDKVADFFYQYPGLQLQTENSQNLSELSLMEKDLILSCTPPQNSELVVYYSQEVQCGLFAAKQYVEQFGMPYDMDDLLNNHRFCEHVNYAKYIPGWCELRKNIKHITYSSHSIHTVKLMTDAGAGIGLLTLRWKSSNMINIANLVADGEIKLSYPLYLIGHKKTIDIPRVKAVAELIKQMIQGTENV